jgi:23S rRNA (pseudouridine1915-N3)-methyltransferase
MSMALVCVGRLKEKGFRLLADEYLKRLTRYGGMTEIEIPDLPEPPGGNAAALEERIRLREGEGILKVIHPSDYVIALTIPGK